jgi:hypothetical protein
MKHFIILAALASINLFNSAQAADVGVSVSIGQPGFYGRIDIGGYPEPRVIYRQPRVVERIYEEHEPIYLHVPPGHIKHWKRHCHEYNACGERVYFVNDEWYNREYAPRYQEIHREHHEEYRDEHRDERRDEYRGGTREMPREGNQDERRDSRYEEHQSDHREDIRGNGHVDGHNHEH